MLAHGVDVCYGRGTGRNMASPDPSPMDSPDTSKADFFKALAEFQQRKQADRNVYQQVNHAAHHGFSWSFEAGHNSSFVVHLNHCGGHSVFARGSSVTTALGGLLGIPPDELPPLCPDDATPQASPSPEPIVPVVKPIKEDFVSDETELQLSDEDIKTAIDLISAMNAETRKNFSISFRHAFKVDRGEKSLQPLITQVKHLQFIQRFVNEVEGKP
jgi:hypothetical protein